MPLRLLKGLGMPKLAKCRQKIRHQLVAEMEATHTPR